jgi:hypothetical protein
VRLGSNPAFNASNGRLSPAIDRFVPKIIFLRRAMYSVVMRLADQIAQCRIPFVVQNARDQRITHLTGAADFAHSIQTCPTRYVLSDDLAGLCTALAYSKGARTLACADLLHIPAERVWIEWCEAPWLNELKRYGFEPGADHPKASGRRGAYVQSSPQGRRGLVKTFWAIGESEFDVLASSMEAYFDFDTSDGEAPTAPDGQHRSSITVVDDAADNADILSRCFRFRYERSWDDYYARAALSPLQQAAVAHHALGAIAIAIPVMLAFFLLLTTRPCLPRRPLMLERLNQARIKSGKRPLLEYIEVSSPILPEYRPASGSESSGQQRRMRRLHHVRGHLVRRGSKLIWRVPHLRGSIRSGAVRSRTVTWTTDPQISGRVLSPPRSCNDAMAESSG